MRWIGLIGWRYVFTVCLVWLLATSVRGQYGEPGGLIKTKDTGLGALDVEYFLESSAADNQALLHIEVSTLKGPSIADRRLDIIYYTDSNAWGANSDLAIHFPIEIREGQSKVREAVPFFLFGGAPYGSNQSANVNWDVGVFENGRDLEESRVVLSSGATTVVSRGRTRSNGTAPFHAVHRTMSGSSMLHVLDDQEQPSTTQAIRLWLAMEQGTIANVLTATMLSPQPFDLTRDSLRVCNFRPVSSLPDSWQYYLQFRIIFIHRDTMQSLMTERTTVAAALKQYVAAGGNLLVLGDKRSDCQELIETWLSPSHGSSSGSSNGPSDKSHNQLLAWNSVRSSIEDWWIRDASGRVRSADGGSRSGRNNSVLATEANLSMVSSVLQVDRTYLPQPLSLAGVARDGMTLAETFSEVKVNAFRRSVTDLYRLFMDETYSLESPLPVGNLVAVDETVTQTIAEEDAAKQTAYPMVSLDLEWIVPYLWQQSEDAVGELERKDPRALAVRRYLLGRVGYIQPDLSQFPQESLSAVTNEMSNSIAMGLHSMQDQLWTFRNMIDSVGRPPIWTFCAIVLLFGMLIGPGLLLFTGWMRRRSLLILLVPCCSLLATVAIVAYETLHEGFDTHARVTGVIALDGKDGFVWTRQTYFSGRPPREGLVFPKDVYFRPVDPEISLMARAYRQRRADETPRDAVRSHIFVEDDAVRWMGALRPREQQQIVVGNRASLEIPIGVQRIDAELVRIENRSSQTLPFVLVRDAYDGYFVCENLEAGGSQQCVRTTVDNLGGTLSRLRAQYILDVPDGVRQLGRWSGMGDQRGSSELIDRVWFQSLNEESNTDKLPPRGFVTLLRTCDAAYMPIAAESIEGQYLVVGRVEW